MNADLLVEADLARLLRQFDSNAEQWWAQEGDLYLGDVLGCRPVLTQYHPVTFHLPGGSYTPDFLHVLADGRLVIVEIKGSTKQKGYRDARAKLRAAADIYRWAWFYEAIVGREGVQKLELIQP